jgi:benzoyl-CoA reductase/2-hydroxyglutaryl-CoA dehydratase subunit BcrC/BadD/HgdB
MATIPTQQERTKTKIPSRLDVINDAKERGEVIAGVLPIHYPRELLRAFRVHPIEIWGPPRIDPTAGVSHLQPYVCSIVRNALAFQQSGGLDVVDLILVPHACDSLQGLASVLLDFIQPKQPVIPFYLPRGEGNAGVEFLIEELKRLYLHLKIITGKTPSDDDLLQAVLQEERFDHAFSELYRFRRKNNISNLDFYRIVRAREFLPGEQFLQIANRGSELNFAVDPVGIPIVISGIVPEPMDVFQAIENYGGMVVADDLASCGRRRYPTGESEDPFERMAERLLNGPPDWNKGDPIQLRLDHLVDMVEGNGARGILFYSVKFCEPELFDLPQLRGGLQSRGIPSLLIEVDVNDSLSNQTLTRIEAFMEMIA